MWSSWLVKMKNSELKVWCYADVMLFHTETVKKLYQTVSFSLPLLRNFTEEQIYNINEFV